jgi:uncharacterized repeat protein (TIGR01451 family)
MRAASRIAATILLLAGLPVPRAAGDVTVPPPAIDGQLQDMIDYANATGTAGFGGTGPDAAKDVRTFDPEFIPCVPVVDNYFPNGFDLLLGVAAYRAAERTLYLGIRTAGAIGDPDGNGNANLSCPGSTIPDAPGIGIDDIYRFSLDTNCDGVYGDVDVELQNGMLTVYDQNGPHPGGIFDYSGTDLEIAIPDLDLGYSAAVRITMNSLVDGLSEEGSTFFLNGQAGPSVRLDVTTDTPTVAPGGFVRFQLRVTNDSVNAPLDAVTLIETLPQGSTYVAGSTRSSGGIVAQPVESEGELAWPTFAVPIGTSVTVSYELQVPSGFCGGPLVDLASVLGSFSSPCLQNGEPQVVAAFDQAQVLCSTTGVDGPAFARLSGAPAPNPFTASTTFGYEVRADAAAPVSITVHDLSGRRVATVFEGERAAGRYEAVWDGRSDAGEKVAPGVYFLRVTVAGRSGPPGRVVFVRN